MSDHAETVKEPDSPAVESAPTETLEVGASEGEAAPSSDSPSETSEDSSAVEALKRRLSQKTYLQREAERERDALRAQLEAQQQPKQPEPQGDLRIPVESDYADPDEYRRDMEAYTDRKVQATLSARDAERAASEAQAAKQRSIAAYREKCAAYAGETPEFVDDVRDSRVPVTEAVMDYLVESDRPAELTHYLAKNPEHAARIEGMGPVAAARELARVELALGDAQGKKLSDAPPPMSDVEDGPTADPDDLSDTLSVEEWMRRRNRRIAS